MNPLQLSMFPSFSMGAMQNFASLASMGGVTAELNINLGAPLDRTSLSLFGQDPFNGNFSNPFGNNAINNLSLLGMGNVPGFGGALNPAGSLFGGLMQQMQSQQQLMMILMLMLVMIMQQKQNGFGGLENFQGTGGFPNGNSGSLAPSPSPSPSPSPAPAAAAASTTAPVSASTPALESAPTSASAPTPVSASAPALESAPASASAPAPASASASTPALESAPAPASASAPASTTTQAQTPAQQDPTFTLEESLRQSDAIEAQRLRNELAKQSKQDPTFTLKESLRQSDAIEAQRLRNEFTKKHKANDANKENITTTLAASSGIVHGGGHGRSFA